MHGYGSLRVLFGFAMVVGLSAGRANGQSGTIVYEWVATLDVETRGEMADVQSVLEGLRYQPFILHFTPSGSLMVRDSSKRGRYVSPVSFRPSSDNLNALVRILEAWYAVEPNVLYQAYVGEDGSSRVKVLGSMDGEKYSVDAGAASLEWRITEEQREHLGYPVNVAVSETGGGQIEAWFAPHIPVPSGPALYGGLPGMILVLSLNGGRTTYAATEISLDGVEDGLIRLPEVGEAVSEEEFRSIVARNIREFRQTVRRMVSVYREVECTVGWRGTLMRCMQSRRDSSR